MAISSAPADAVEQLRIFLRANIAGIAKVYDGFPAPSQKLEYPSITIFMGKPRFMPAQTPYFLSKGDEIPGVGDNASTWPIRRIVGSYEIRLQLDVWTSTKDLRHEIWEKILKAFNLGDAPGLNLQLTNYFNTYAHYSLSDFEFLDRAEDSQRDEWRIRAEVIVDCKAVSEKTEVLIEEIENNLETPDVIPEAEESSSEPEII